MALFFRRFWIFVGVILLAGGWGFSACQRAECPACSDSGSPDPKLSEPSDSEKTSVDSPFESSSDGLHPDGLPLESPQDGLFEITLEGKAEAAPENPPESLTEAVSEIPKVPFTFLRIVPNPIPANRATTVVLEGEKIPSDAVGLLGPNEILPTRWLSSKRLEVDLPPLREGFHPLAIRSPSNSDAGPHLLEVVNRPPLIADPGLIRAVEEKESIVPILVTDPDGDPLTVYPTHLPPGAFWDAATQSVRFRPTFIQGGQTYTVEVAASDGSAFVRRSFSIEAQDTIAPPPPTISKREARPDHERLTLAQKTDAFLDSPGYAGRSFQALVSVPQAQPSKRYPVRLLFHGFGGSPSASGDASEFLIQPHDPMNTYGWGFSSSLPASPPTKASVIPPYTIRRTLHLLAWVLATYPHADPERVYLVGASMGGAAAKTLGLLFGRHFAYIEATIGQAIPRNHRPSRLQQLTTLWGSPSDQTLDEQGGLVWDRIDLTRALRDEREAREPFLFTKHGKDDETIHFGAVVLPSPLTQISLFTAFQSLRLGHYAVWDEGGHGTADPILGDFWSDWSWHRVKDATTYLRRDLAYPAFSRSAFDDDPGTGKGNGLRPFHVERGYAGQVSVAGDTGWDGDIAGAFNRHLRWDSTKIQDTFERFEMPLRVLQGQGDPPPRPSYPARGDRYEGPLPLHVDVTPRRRQRFLSLPKETILWTFGTLGGVVQADLHGDITIPQIPFTAQWQILVLQRKP